MTEKTSPIMYVRLTVRYHQPFGVWDGTRDHYVTVERFTGEDDARMIGKAIREFRRMQGHGNLIESVNLYPGRWDEATAVAIDANDNIADLPGDAA